MKDNHADGSSSLGSIEAKIDTLTSEFRQFNQRFHGRIDTVESRLSGVESRLSGVETHVEDIARQLAKVQITADETKEFSRNSWDSLKSLTTNMEERFKAAEKDRDEQFQLVHSAINRWGERVETLERRARRARKRRP